MSDAIRERVLVENRARTAFSLAVAVLIIIGAAAVHISTPEEARPEGYGNYLLNLAYLAAAKGLADIYRLSNPWRLTLGSEGLTVHEGYTGALQKEEGKFIPYTSITAAQAFPASRSGPARIEVTLKDGEP